MTLTEATMMLAGVVAVGAVLLVVYTYALYPLLLKAMGPTRRPRTAIEGEWPAVSLILPVYNEAEEVGDLLESVLALDYPTDRLQVLVISDASTDGTDEIVEGYAGRGVELVRMAERGGKTVAENAAARHVTGGIIVSTDASTRILPGALRPLIAAFADPTVGVASGRDVSVSRVDGERNVGESGYVGYEMWVRSLETRVDGIVGASGCFYAMRRELHEKPLPAGLSRDFASALVARENGYRAVSVDQAVCLVPRTASLDREYRRKVRTVTRGMQTLWHKRRLLNPVRYGLFAWMLWSHKICRWGLPWAAVAGLLGVTTLGAWQPWLLLAPAGAALMGGLAWAGWRWPESRPLPSLLSVPAFLAASNVAILVASVHAIRRIDNSVWEPTRRERADDAAEESPDQGKGPRPDPAGLSSGVAPDPTRC